MTDHAQLEQRYRWLLACYPRAFRAEHEEEMLVVLMASGRSGQRRPGLANSADLLVNALLMRMRPGAPRSTPTMFWAVRMMAVCALLELAALATVLVTQGDLSTAIARHFPAYSAAHVHTLVHGQVLSVAIGAPIVAIAWLWLAWANGRGHGWARLLLGVLFGLTSLSLLAAIGQDAPTLAPADMIAGAALWFVALVALVLIVSPASEDHYRRTGTADRSRGAGRIVTASAS
jgi:hypothetical protein